MSLLEKINETLMENNELYREIYETQMEGAKVDER